jgi:lysophospholipid acyltransferase (LPLAT)-like uncharacterized protein
MPINTSRIIKSERFLDFFYAVIRAYCRTFRVTTINDTPWQEYLKQGGSLLFCAWHQQVFPTMAYIPRFKHLAPPLMISLSNDGDIGAGIVERAGWTTVRGSSSRGGFRALKQMIRELRRACMAGHIVDGPRGPAGIVKPGTITLAQAAHAAIVPVGITADKAWYFKSWDRFMLPRPFAKICFVFGEIIHPADPSGKMGLEDWRMQVESAMRPYLK